MKHLHKFLLIIFSILFFFSCEKRNRDSNYSFKYKLNSSFSQINKFFEDNLNEATQTINVNSSVSNQSITSDKGIVYTFGSNTFINTLW